MPHDEPLGDATDQGSTTKYLRHRRAVRCRCDQCNEDSDGQGSRRMHLSGRTRRASNSCGHRNRKRVAYTYQRRKVVPDRFYPNNRWRVIYTKVRADKEIRLIGRASVRNAIQRPSLCPLLTDSQRRNRGYDMAH